MSGIAGSIAIALALAVAGGAAERSVAALPAPAELVPNTVALVSHIPPRLGTVTRAELRHAVILAAAQEGRRGSPQPSERGHRRLERMALESLLEGIWIHGLAAEWNIVVTPRQISRKLAAVKRESFESEAEYRQFLREARFTKRDVRERVEVQLLSVRLQRRLVAQFAKQTRSEAEENEAFRQFVAEFNRRWRARTVCAPQYAIERCSNGPNVR